MLMAGLDGIANKLNPGDPIDKNLYDLPPAELAKIPTVAGSLREALDSLDKDRDFLKMGGVMTDDMIDAYIELKHGREHALRDGPASDRVRHVLLGLIGRHRRHGEARERSRAFALMGVRSEVEQHGDEQRRPADQPQASRLAAHPPAECGAPASRHEICAITAISNPMPSPATTER